MKWNAEWVDLQNIDRMVAECWRFNDVQLKSYAKQLRQQQDLIFAGVLGTSFVAVLDEIVAGRAPKDWSGIQKDVKRIRDCISRGQQWDEDAWQQQYQELSQDPKFHTILDGAFLELLAERLEIRLSEEQKALRRDIRQIQKLCDEYTFESNEQFQAAAAYVQNEQEHLFTSWLGQGFADQVKLQNKKRAKQSKKDARLPQRKNNAKENIILEAVEAEHLEWDDGQFEDGLTEADSFGGVSLDEVYSEAMQMAEEYDRKAEPEQQTGQVKKRRKKLPIGKVLLGILAAGLLVGGILLALHFGPEKIAERIRQMAWEPCNVEATMETVSLDEEQLSAGWEEEPKETIQKILAFELLPFQLETEIENPGRKEKSPSGNGRVDQQPDTGNGKGAGLPEILGQYRQFAEAYPDVYGWLKIPGTEIDQPVMQCKEDTTDYFYLHHNYRGQETAAGSFFVDSKSSIFPQDQNTVIYGHNMQNGHNFGLLTNYEDPEYYKAHNLIQFDTIYETGTYEIVAVAKTRVLYQDETGFRYYYLFNYNDKDTFEKCKEFIEKNQLYDTGIALKKTDKTIMLSTCEYSIENGRLVVIARKK